VSASAIAPVKRGDSASSSMAAATVSRLTFAPKLSAGRLPRTVVTGQRVSR
jgi:hypothetical protein